jgi:glycolate oxidase FAD binding subunit
VDLTAFAADVGDAGPVTIAGLGTRGGPVPDVRCVRAPSGIEWIQDDEMIFSCGAGTPVDELAAALAEVGQRVALPAGGTVGGALAVGRTGVRRLGDGAVRNTLLQARSISAAGEVVKTGGPTVKNVSGFDLCRLLVGSHGTLGFFGDVILRTRPVPLLSQWCSVPASEPFTLFATLHRPVSVLWDGTTAWALLEGHPADIAEQVSLTGMRAVDGPPPLPPGRTSLAPSCIGALTGTFVAEVGVGIVHGDAPRPTTISTANVEVGRRVKHELDPGGRLNPGVVVS